MLKDALIYQDIGKGEEKIIAELYSYSNLDPLATIGDARGFLKEDGVVPEEADAGQIADYLYYALKRKYDFNGAVMLGVYDDIARVGEQHNVASGDVTETQEGLGQVLKDAGETKAGREFFKNHINELPIRIFWDAHVYHSVKAVEDNRDEIDNSEEVREIVAGHHHSQLQGNTLLTETTPLSITGEVIDKFHAALNRGGVGIEDNQKRWDNAKAYMENISLPNARKTQNEEVAAQYEQTFSAIEKAYYDPWVVDQEKENASK